MIHHLVLGYGEVGAAVHLVLDREEIGHVADAHDVLIPTPRAPSGLYDAIHVCIPYTVGATFEAAISDAMRLHARSLATIVVVHSTVPLNTCRSLAARLRARVVSSPVRGVHPRLHEGLLTFHKLVGGPGAETVAEWFRDVGMKVRVFPDAETPEAVKLWDTTQYGWQIVLAKEIAAWCKQWNLDFEHVYRQANQDYNDGYEALGKPHVMRPSLFDVPGPIGGHCVLQNLSLLGPVFIANVIAAASTRYEDRAHGD